MLIAHHSRKRPLAPAVPRPVAYIREIVTQRFLPVTAGKTLMVKVGVRTISGVTLSLTAL